jgi:hypothetical protein
LDHRSANGRTDYCPVGTASALLRIDITERQDDANWNAAEWHGEIPAVAGTAASRSSLPFAARSGGSSRRRIPSEAP